MKSLGIKSEFDEIGSVTLPDILLNLCDVKIGDTLEICLEGQQVIMKKYPSTCIFCGSEKDIEKHIGKSICKSCVNELKSY